MSITDLGRGQGLSDPASVPSGPSAQARRMDDTIWPLYICLSLYHAHDSVTITSL